MRRPTGNARAFPEAGKSVVLGLFSSSSLELIDEVAAVKSMAAKSGKGPALCHDCDAFGLGISPVFS